MYDEAKEKKEQMEEFRVEVRSVHSAQSALLRQSNFFI